MANTTLKEDGKSQGAAQQSLASLDGKFNLDGYPSHYSDVAAVMVLDHQIGMTNFLTRTGWETRIAQDQMVKHPEEKANAQRLIEADAQELVDYMLFVDEPALPGKFESTSGFAAKFETGGITDSKGRSLKQLDLTKRLMRYPCSYMIYSTAFDGLPDAVRQAVYSRLWAVLSGTEKARK